MGGGARAVCFVYLLLFLCSNCCNAAFGGGRNDAVVGQGCREWNRPGACVARKPKVKSEKGPPTSVPTFRFRYSPPEHFPWQCVLAAVGCRESRLQDVPRSASASFHASCFSYFRAIPSHGPAPAPRACAGPSGCRTRRILRCNALLRTHRWMSSSAATAKPQQQRSHAHLLGRPSRHRSRNLQQRSLPRRPLHAPRVLRSVGTDCFGVFENVWPRAFLVRATASSESLDQKRLRLGVQSVWLQMWPWAS